MFLPISVKARERLIDGDRLPEDAIERSSCARPLEALEPPARVDAASGKDPPFRQLAVLRCEPKERRLRSLPPTAGTTPDGPVSRSSGGKAAACALWRGSVKLRRSRGRSSVLLDRNRLPGRVAHGP